MRRLSLPLALAFVLALAPPARAAHFDLIHVDTFDLTLCANGCGITLAGTDFALIVNKGPGDIGGAELFGTTFTSTSSNPDFILTPFVNNPGNPVIPPIHPQEAVGSVSPYNNNIVLLPLVEAGETHRNTYPTQFLAFEVTRLTGAYEGPVQFDVSMTVGGETAHFVMTANTHVGLHDIQFTSAARTSSSSSPTPALHRSWGALKSLYR